MSTSRYANAGVGVDVAVGVEVGVRVTVGVGVIVGVLVGVGGIGVTVGVAVTVGVGVFAAKFAYAEVSLDGIVKLHGLELPKLEHCAPSAFQPVNPYPLAAAA